MKFANYLELLKKHFDVESDYELAKRLGVSKQRVSNWRSGRSLPDFNMAMKIAQILEIEDLQVLADIESQRSKHPKGRALWSRIADGLRRTAIFAAVAVAPTLTSPDAQARFDNSKNVPTPTHQEAGQKTQCSTRRGRTGSAFALAMRALLTPSGPRLAL